MSYKKDYICRNGIGYGLKHDSRFRLCRRYRNNSCTGNCSGRNTGS